MVKKVGKKVARKVGAKKARTPTLRQRLKDEGLLQGKSHRQAALDAGYAPSTANSNIYKEQEKARTQERIKERIQEAQIDTNEIIGTLVSQMRGDFADILPDDPFFKQARERGVSHLIKELETTERLILGEEDEPNVTEVRRKIKIHDSQAAAKQLCNVFGLEKEAGKNPEDEKVRVEKAITAFITRTGASREDAIRNLTPFIPEVSNYAN